MARSLLISHHNDNGYLIMSSIKPYITKIAFLFSLIVFTVFFMGVAFPNTESKSINLGNSSKEQLTFYDLFHKACLEGNHSPLKSNDLLSNKADPNDDEELLRSAYVICVYPTEVLFVIETRFGAIRVPVTQEVLIAPVVINQRVEMKLDENQIQSFEKVHVTYSGTFNITPIDYSNGKYEMVGEFKYSSITFSSEAEYDNGLAVIPDIIKLHFDL